MTIQEYGTNKVRFIKDVLGPNVKEKNCLQCLCNHGVYKSEINNPRQANTNAALNFTFLMEKVPSSIQHRKLYPLFVAEDLCVFFTMGQHVHVRHSWKITF